MGMLSVLRYVARSKSWLGHSKKLAAIKVVVLDVDGVLTDGGLWYGPEGELTKRFHVRDGLGIRLLQHYGVEVAFLSGGRGGATEVRAQQLGIHHCFVGAKDKVRVLDELLNELKVSASQLLFVGDDLNDLPLLGKVGLLVATGDAARALRRSADAVLIQRGGQGAVRELAERLLRAQGVWERINQQGWRDQND